jgi:hypothetical protein
VNTSTAVAPVITAGERSAAARRSVQPVRDALKLGLYRAGDNRHQTAPRLDGEAPRAAPDRGKRANYYLKGA